MKTPRSRADEQAGFSGVEAMEKPVRIMCPNLACRKVLAVPQTARGKTVRCRSCGTAIRVPQASLPSSQGGSSGKS